MTDEADSELDPARLDLRSADVIDERARALADLFPEAVRDGKLDVEALQGLLGDVADSGPERFGLSWPGKATAIRMAQSRAEGALVPMRDESVEWGSTKNIIIEGENLEVLKLLQRSYHGQVKLIYIDPPYNTGKDFVYPDNYRDPLSEYLRYSGQTGENGGRLAANAETGGRYHSAWLSMMWPRLHLARSLLRDDGVVAVSIDDVEAPRLRLLLDEVFGEENFIATVVWEKVYAPKNTARHLSVDHDYILIYARNAGQWSPSALPRTPEMESRYKNPDSDSRGPWKAGDLSARNFYAKGTYSITCPSGRVIPRPPSGNYWRVSPEKFKELDADDRIWWGDDGDNVPAVKRFLSEVKDGSTPRTLWRYGDVGHTQDAKKQLLRLVDFESSDSVFDTPKPVQLMRRLLELTTSAHEPALVLDFFAGSGTLGAAVLRQNAADGGLRRFVLVQLPEPLDDQNLPTIAALARARVSAAAAEIAGDITTLTPPGFRSYRLDSSAWAPSVADRPVGDEQALFSPSIDARRDDEALLAEVLLARGFELVAPTTWIQIAGERVASVAEGALMVSFTRRITPEFFEALVACRPAQIILLEEGFGARDEVKVNALQHLRSVNAAGETPIELLLI